MGWLTGHVSLAREFQSVIQSNSPLAAPFRKADSSRFVKTRAGPSGFREFFMAVFSPIVASSMHFLRPSLAVALIQRAPVSSTATMPLGAALRSHPFPAADQQRLSALDGRGGSHRSTF
ncbi:hypothetical protein [Streptomyces lavendulae]|uniref:hypothetical protein n=1 Tax=Streptomyces lavendulae TaxID=1914 RepID=UPI003D7F8C96